MYYRGSDRIINLKGGPGGRLQALLANQGQVIRGLVELSKCCPTIPTVLALPSCHPPGREKTAAALAASGGGDASPYGPGPSWAPAPLLLKP
eukprot:768735-Hanusia_phi.AAC.4